MPIYRLMTRQIHLLTGSKHEQTKYTRQIKEESGREAHRCFRVTDLSFLQPVLYIAGTGHLTPHFEELKEATVRRKGVVHYYDTPGWLWMPALEIAHEFAEYLGIDPEWRYEGP